jgi:hypothetical protein
MGKKSSPCGRSDKAVEVQDHGNGYMFVGTTDIEQARRLLGEYVDNPEGYGFASRHWLEDERAEGVWLTVEPFALRDGACDWAGRPLPR